MQTRKIMEVEKFKLPPTSRWNSARVTTPKFAQLSESAYMSYLIYLEVCTHEYIRYLWDIVVCLRCLHVTAMLRASRSVLPLLLSVKKQCNFWKVKDFYINSRKRHLNRAKWYILRPPYYASNKNGWKLVVLPKLLC